jgi:TolB protein
MTTIRNAGAFGATLLTLLALAGIVGLLPGLASAPAIAAIELDITKGQVQPLPIAIPAFIGAAPDEGKFGADIAGVIAANLDRSGLFRPLPRRVLYRAGHQLQSAALLRRLAHHSGSGPGHRPDHHAARRQVARRVPPLGRLCPDQVLGFQFVTSPKNWRRMGHMISDAIYKALTGEDGYFD